MFWNSCTRSTKYCASLAHEIYCRNIFCLVLPWFFVYILLELGSFIGDSHHNDILTWLFGHYDVITFPFILFRACFFHACVCGVITKKKNHWMWHLAALCAKYIIFSIFKTIRFFVHAKDFWNYNRTLICIHWKTSYEQAQDTIFIDPNGFLVTRIKLEYFCFGSILFCFEFWLHLKKNVSVKYSKRINLNTKLYEFVQLSSFLLSVVAGVRGQYS